MWHERHNGDPAHVWLRQMIRSVGESLGGITE
jgi:hypothetical protein